MSSLVLPTVRIPAVVAGDGIDGEYGEREVPAVELPPSNKFGIAWAQDLIHAPTSAVTEHPTSLPSSDTEGELSDASQPQPGQFPFDFEHTPTNRLAMEEDPLDTAHATPLPRLSRAFSMPVSSQLGHLKNPRRVPSSASDNFTPSPVIQLSSELSHYHELSLELADSVQLVTQTLLQLSPPQVLDPAKEQFSACAVSIPTPSISALFTTVKNLNYMSANMAAFGPPSSSSAASFRSVSSASLSGGPRFESNDFDIGEMLQSVGDAVSGLAAEAGVDVVLYHGDVGMRHVAVKGDECGVSYTLTHLVQQVIATSRRGDSIEIGLFIAVASSDTQELLLDSPPGMPTLRSSIDSLQGRVRCIFDIAHKFNETGRREGSFSGDLVSRPGSPAQRPEPTFKSIVLRSLLNHLGATFTPNLAPKLFSFGRTCELTFDLDAGDHAAVNPSVVLPPEDGRSTMFSNVRIANEPTLEELTQFVETLRGKKVTLYASSKGSFAHHLTSYLTAWGLDVSHVSHETGEGIPEADETAEAAIDAAASASLTGARNDIIYGTHSVTPPLGLGVEGLTPQIGVEPQHGKTATSPLVAPTTGSPLSFIFIDDNVSVLRERLRKVRSEYTYGLHLHARKRPSLAANHRPRSSPQVVRSLGLPTPGAGAPSTVIVHFTSLANFKLVRDVVQSVLTPWNSPNVRIPEVIVIPKPAGPRRFLTALHTAVTKPIIDPFFSPIATSPMSPGLHAHQPFFNMSPSSPGMRPGPPSSTGSRTNSERSARSPKDVLADPMNLPLPSPLSMSDGMEYFADAAVKLGTSPSTGLVIQSPDGQPAGIFFHPKRTAGKPQSGGYPMDRQSSQIGQAGVEVRVRRAGSRRTSDPHVGHHVGTPNPSVTTSRRPVMVAEEAAAATPFAPGSVRVKGRKVPTPGVEEDRVKVVASAPASAPVSPADPKLSPSLPAREAPARRSSQATPPLSPHADGLGAGVAPGPVRARRRATHRAGATPPLATTSKKGTPGGDTNIVPPISVLIVDDNPINQTILSTFMRKKKIKYDVAKNGQEAVTKWRSGGFHLILMDIQMPVMDGIEATTEIRRLEKMHGSAGPGTPISDHEQRTPSDIASVDSKTAGTPYRSSVIIVALTASSLQSDRVAALAAGCNDFLTKPVSLQWLNSKIIEWGSIKALQMWADLRPEVVKSISSGQAAQAQNVARKLHVPEGRATPNSSRSPSVAGRPAASVAESASGEAPRPMEIIPEALPPKVITALKTAAVSSPDGDTTPKATNCPGLIITEATPTPKSTPGGGDGSVLTDAAEAPLPAVAPPTTLPAGAPPPQEPVPEPEALTPPILAPISVRAELPPIEPPADVTTPKPDELTPSTLVADDTIEWAKGRGPVEAGDADALGNTCGESTEATGTIPGGTAQMLAEPGAADADRTGGKDGPSD